MYIQLWEPPKQRRLRIKNKIRFMLFVLVVVLTIITCFIPRRGTGQVSYKPYRVAYGDTYWGIAKELQEQGYRSRADIRDVVHELVELSGIPAHELKEGDIIFVPNIE